MEYDHLNKEEFTLKDCVIGGDDCVLITPNNIKCKWNKDNLIYRSIILRKSDGYVVNSSFKKFFNWSEQPDLEPFPSGPFTAVEKHDGSTLCIGVYKNQIIHRTRGTVNAQQLDNGVEIEFLLNKYPEILRRVHLNPLWSFIFEWETPSNIIVLRKVKEPTLTLIGVIDNRDLSYAPQNILDLLAIDMRVERPKTYAYSSVKECIEDVTVWKGREGVVLYSQDGQSFRKIKADEYCELHKICTGIKNINQVVDLFMTTEKFTKYEDFYKYVEKTLDYEVAEKIKDDMAKVVDSYVKVLDKLNKVKLFVDGVRGESFSRKDQAMAIMQNWGDWRKGVAFQILDNKEIDDNLLNIAIKSSL